MDEYVWLPSTLLARTICPYHQCYLLYNLSFCACLVVYRAASLTSIWLVGSPLVVLNGIKTWIRKIVHPKWKETRQLMNEWKATKVHVYVQCFNFLSKPERIYWSSTPQLDTVIIEGSPMAERQSMETIGPNIFHHKIPMVTQNFTVAKLAILTKRYLH